MSSGSASSPKTAEEHHVSHVSVHLLDMLVQGRSRVLDLFRRADTDNSGAVDRNEFCGLIVNTHELDFSKIEHLEESAHELFDAIDSSGDGHIQLKELSRFLKDAKRTHKQGVEAKKASDGWDAVTDNVDEGEKASLLESIKGLITKERRLFQMQLLEKEEELAVLRRDREGGRGGAGGAGGGGGAAPGDLRALLEQGSRGERDLPALPGTQQTQHGGGGASPGGGDGSGGGGGAGEGDAVSETQAGQALLRGADAMIRNHDLIRRQFPRLRRLLLAGRCAFEKPLNRVCQLLPWLHTVVYVDLSNNNLPDEAGEYVKHA